MTEQNIERCHKIAKHYGCEKQTVKSAEECCELAQILLKIVNSDNSSIYRGKLIEELSDVMVCVEHIRYLYAITDEDIEQVVCYKLSRQEQRIEDENQKTDAV